MSLHFDMVINCDLREDLPQEVVEAIKCLTQETYQLKSKPILQYRDHGNVWDSFSDKHFLAPDPAHNIISNFQPIHRLTIPTENSRKVYRYRLQYCGSGIHDDFWAHHHMPFVYWLATVSYDSFMGYYMETHNQGLGIKHLIVENGRLKD